MSNKHPLSFAVCAIPLIVLPGLAQIPSPVRELSRLQEVAVGGSGFTEIALSSADFKTAALISVKTDGNGSRSSVDRSANAMSAVYAGASLPDALSSPATPATSGAPPSTQIFDFKKSGDSAQGWATMSAAGLPYLYTRAFGKASASGTAAWTARIFVPTHATNMYVRFTLPQIQVKGVNEQDGPSRYQARFRAELLLNGHPVWSSEAIRLNVFNGNPGYCPDSNTSQVHEINTLYESYGTAPLGLSAADKNDWSTANPVTLALGSFPAGQALDLTLVVRADTSMDNKCCFKNNEYFCTGATSVVDWDAGVVTPVRFWGGPAI